MSGEPPKAIQQNNERTRLRGRILALPPEIERVVAQHSCLRVHGTFLSRGWGDWKVAPTRRVESLRYGGGVKMRPFS